MRRVVLPLALLAGLAAPGAASADEDGQVWTQANAQGPIGGGWIVYGELQTRFTDDVSRLGQSFVRPALGRELKPGVSAMLGYAYVRSEPLGGRATDEHRVWQQLAFPIHQREGGWRVTGRSRLEQRSVVGSGDVGLRMRHLLRAQHPLPGAGGLQGLVWTEAFYAFNGTDWGQREGFDQVRNFVGLSVPLWRKGLTLEPGYLNQYIVRSGPNRVAHVANLTLSHRW